MPNSFRLLNISSLLSPTLGLPRGTFGRNTYSIEAIVLHTLRCDLDAYDAQETNPFIRTKAEPRHPSVHYAVGPGGEIQQYVTDADLAWGMFDYDMAHFPAVFPASSWSLLSTYPGVSPDAYVLHVAITSGEAGLQAVGSPNVSPVTAAMFTSLTRLVAYLCHTYGITADATHIISHDGIDEQFAHTCVGDDYPYAAVLAGAQAIILAGGWPLDPVFDKFYFGFDPAEYFGPWTVGVSRVSSAAYISNDPGTDYGGDNEEGYYFGHITYPWPEYDQEFP